jgi:hypothetical protein
MIRYAIRILALSTLTLSASVALAQDQLPYKEGPVIQVTAVRTAPGKFTDYVRYLTSGEYYKVMSEAKKQGLVKDFTFYSAVPRTPADANLYIVETYPNYAVFDGLTDKMTVISNQVWGSLSKSDQADANRESMRKIIGTEIMQQLLPR